MEVLKKYLLLVTVLSLITVCQTSLAITNKTGKGDKEESIQSLCGELENAVNTRHFDTAKEAVTKMLPLMKKDLKDGKKMLSSWDKTDNDLTLDKETFASQLEKKSKIYTSTKGLVSSSPAAIRVKGKQLVEMLNEYASLVNQ